MMVLGLLLAFIGAGRIDDSRVDTTHLTTVGKILESKVTMDHSEDSPRGGRIFYRVEARVVFEVDGKTYDRWLQASEISSAKELLEVRLAEHPQTCQVYWSEGHLDNARCRL
jgi:hypothetical protein